MPNPGNVSAYGTLGLMAKRGKLTVAEAGRLGGSAKTSKPKGLAALSPEERKAIAAAGLAARRKKAAKAKKAATKK